jgi:phosphate transport system substrate-binding protein
MKFADEKVEIEQVIIAYDALTVIVNPANSVSKLTREQLEQIFRSNQNWKEVGGADEKSVLQESLHLGLMSFLKMKLWTRKLKIF